MKAYSSIDGRIELDDLIPDAVEVSVHVRRGHGASWGHEVLLDAILNAQLELGRASKVRPDACIHPLRASRRSCRG